MPVENGGIRIVNNRRIMVSGAGHNQIPYIERAKNLGLFTVAIDGNPDAPGFAAAHAREVVDIRDAEAVVRAAKKLRVDAIYPSAEVGVEAAAAAAHCLGLPGITAETARKVRHKGEMRRALQGQGINSNPPFAVVSNLSEANDAASQVGFPLVVKPADGQGSRSVARVLREDELEAAVSSALDASYCGEAVIERFMKGEEVSVEGVVFDGEVMHAAITGKIRSEPPHRFDLGIYLPADLTADDERFAEELAAKCLRAIGFTNGSTHTEVIFTEEGPRLVEIAGRLGGGRIPTDLVPLVYGVDLATESIRTCMGDRPDLERRHTRGAALLWFTPPAGRLARVPSLDPAKEIPGVEDVVWYVNEGDALPRPIDCVSRDKIGYVMTSGPTAQEAVATARTAKQAVERTLEVVPA
jgi:biotin carboxylase